MKFNRAEVEWPIFKKLPFYFKSHLNQGNGGFPDSFPFELFFDNEMQMYRQRETKQLQGILKEVYALGSLVDGSISNESGKIYIEKVKDYIHSQVPDLNKKAILEVGCGNGDILQALLSSGARILGVDPGDHQKVGNFEILREFFPSPLIKSKFDIVISFFVLEHIADPVSFLLDQKKILHENGKIIVGVPDCQPFLNEGDYSIFFHEHFNYFTKLSIEKIAAKANLTMVHAEILEGMLIATLISDENNSSKKDDIIIFDRHAFELKASLFNKNLGNLFARYNENEIAVYVPGRALNALYIANKKNCRLVDDNSELHGKYLPWLSNPVESFDQLLNNPPACLLIYSRTFGERIKKRCELHVQLDNTDVHKIAELDEKG